MLTTPETNIKLRDADVQAIEIAQTRLATIKAQETASQRATKALQEECVSLTNRKTYLEEQVAEQEKQNALLEEKKVSLDKEIVAATVALDTAKNEATKLSGLYTEKLAGLEEREKSIAASEHSLNVSTEKLKLDTLKLADERALTEQNRKILATAIQAVQWN